MKLFGLAAVSVSLALLTGCGSGLTSRAKAPADVFKTMDVELANAIGTTSLTSADAPPVSRLPDDRMPVSGAKQYDDTPPPVQTWGASPEQDPNFNEEYGF